MQKVTQVKFVQVLFYLQNCCQTNEKKKKKKPPHTLLLIQNLCKKEYYKLIQANKKHEIYTCGVVMSV